MRQGGSEAPSGLDQVAVYFAESEAGLETTRLRDLRRMLSDVPFEPAMLSIARIAAKVYAFGGDQDLQLGLAEELFEDAPVVERMQRFLRTEPNGVLFAEQHMFILLRLLIERAQDGSLEQELDAEHVHRMRMALIGVTSATEWIAEATGHQPLTGDLRDALAFFVQNGAYNRKGQPMGELARAQELYERVFHAKSQTTSSSYCPLDEWMQEDYTFDITQQMSFGFALSAMTSTWATSDEAGTKSYVLPEHLQDLFVKFGWEAHDRAALELLSADRQWFRSEFDRLGDSPSSIAWDIRPFMQRRFSVWRTADSRCCRHEP